MPPTRTIQTVVAKLRTAMLVAIAGITFSVLGIWYWSISSVHIFSSSSDTVHVEAYMYDSRIMIRRFVGTYHPLPWESTSAPAWSVNHSAVDRAFGTVQLPMSDESWHWSFRQIKFERPRGGRGGGGGDAGDWARNWPESGDLSCSTLILPVWSLGVPLILFWCVFGGVRIGSAIRKRRRADLGLCTECGYDLRQTSVRCPECSMPIPPTRRIKTRDNAT